MQTTRSLMMTVAVLALALVSCGDSDRSAADSSPSASSALAPGRSVVEPVSPSSPEPTSAISAISATSATEVPSVEEQASSGFLAAMAARERCDYEPLTCDYAAIAVSNSEMDLLTRDTVGAHVQANLRAVHGNGDVRTRVESVSIVGDAAYVISCIYDTEVLFDVGRSPTAVDDIVFNDFKQSDRVRWELRQEHGRWLILRGVGLQSLTGGDLCGF